MRKLESLALWSERELFDGQGDKERGLICSFRYVFQKEQFVKESENGSATDFAIEEEWNAILNRLSGAEEWFVLKNPQQMLRFCKKRVHDHIPYSFNRECWGFRYLTAERAWYLALTPWNVRHQFEVFCYDRSKLFDSFAAERDLPEICYGILRFTGELIRIRFGASDWEVLSSPESDRTENQSFADTKNAEAKRTAAQIAAMENGVLYGWDTPLATPWNYDKDGHFFMPEERKGEKRK